MFDLFRSRAKAVRIMLGAMLTIVAFSMLVYLIPGAGITTPDAGDQVVAEIGKTEVTVQQVQAQIRNQLQGQQLPPDLAAVYIPQIVDQAIADRAVAYEAQQLGFRVSDRDLADTLRSLPFGSLPPDQYKQYVETQLNQEVPDFENNVRLNNFADDLKMLAQEGVIVTPAEVEAEYRLRHDKIKIDYIGFDPTKLAASLKPTPEQIQAYFNRNKNFFNMPETRSLQLIVADQAKVAENIQIPDGQVLSYYNAHKDQYRTPERVQARHILFSTANKPKDEVPKIQAQAESVLKQIKAGGDFAELAKKYSQDPGSAVKGGDLGWVVRGQMVKNFEDAVFALKPKEISNVITTEYGFHIIQVLDKQPPHVQTLDEVKSQILATLRNQTVFDRMQDLADQAHAQLVKAPQNAEQIAKQLGLAYTKVDNYAQGGPLGTIGSDAQMAATVMALKPGEVSQVVQTGNQLAIVELIAIRPPHPAQLSEVENQARQQYLQVEGSRLVGEKSMKAAELLKQNGGDLKAAAKAVGLSITSTDFFAMNGAAEGIGAATFMGKYFDLPLGSTFGPVNAGTQTIVGKIMDRQKADMSQLPQERDQIVLQLKGRKVIDQTALFQDSILNQLIKSGKVKKHQDVINRLIAQYKG